MRLRLGLLLFLPVLAALAFLAWPYWSAWRIAQAFEEGDTARMTRAVDWTSVRAGLKDDLGAALQARTGSDPDQPFAAIAGALLPALAEPMIERWVTPETIGALVRQATAERDRPDGRPGGGGTDPATRAGERADQPDRPGDFERFRRAVRSARFTGPAAFELVLVDPGTAPDEQVPVRVELGLRGARWIVERLHLPESFLRTAGD